MIIGYCHQIVSDVKKVDGNYQAFEDNLTIQNSISMCLLTIGELINKKLSPNLKENYQDFNWTRLVQARNEFAHAYFQFDLEQIWELVSEIEKLQDYCNYILSDLR